MSIVKYVFNPSLFILASLSGMDNSLWLSTPLYDSPLIDIAKRKKDIAHLVSKKGAYIRDDEIIYILNNTRNDSHEYLTEFISIITKETLHTKKEIVINKRLCKEFCLQKKTLMSSFKEPDEYYYRDMMKKVMIGGTAVGIGVLGVGGIVKFLTNH